jgi:hypothetical protein
LGSLAYFWIYQSKYYNQKHYNSLAKTFASTFYVKSKQKLELRLKTLLTPGVIKENKTDILSTDKNLDPEYYINFLLKQLKLKGVQIFLKVILKKLNLIYRIVVVLFKSVGIVKTNYF